MLKEKQLSFEEIIIAKIDHMLAQREIVVLKEKEFEDGSTMQVCYNSQASNLIDLAAQLKWVLHIYKQEQDSKLFPHCLDSIVSDSSVVVYDEGSGKRII